MGLYLYDIYVANDKECIKSHRKDHEVITFAHSGDFAAYFFGLRDDFNRTPVIPNSGKVEPGDRPDWLSDALQYRDIEALRVMTREQLESLDGGAVIKSMYQGQEDGPIELVCPVQWRELKSLLTIPGATKFYFAYY